MWQRKINISARLKFYNCICLFSMNSLRTWSTVELVYNINKNEQFLSVCITFGFHLSYHLLSRQFILMYCFCEWFEWKKCSFVFLLKHLDAHSHINIFLTLGKNEQNAYPKYTFNFQFVVLTIHIFEGDLEWQRKSIPASAGPTCGKCLKLVEALSF